MNIGDKVRMLRGKEEGIVTRIIDSKLIEVEIEDGFQIPVMKNEVVVIAKEEANFFRQEESPKTPEKSSKASPAVLSKEEGVFLAFRPVNDRILAVYLINRGAQQIPFAVFEESKKGLKGLASGSLAAGSHQKLAEVSLQNFEEWPAYVFQFIFFTPGIVGQLKMPLTKKINFKASSFYRSKRVAPVLNAEAYTFRLDGEAITVDPEQVKDSLSGNRISNSAALPTQAPPPVLDLHIEALSPNAASMSSQDILNLQLSTFAKHLDQAIASGIDEVIYVHGVGNGTLRDAIHKYLSKQENISFYKDAQKNKFGYGATLVQIK